MILIGGRIFVIFLAIRHVCVNIEGYLKSEVVILQTAKS